MRCRQSMYATACVAISLLLVLCGQAAAEGFNPQPEPPGSWSVEGYIDMWIEVADQTTAAMPFGINPDIVGDSDVDFSAGIIARFDADTTADEKPVDGEYSAELQFFQVQIGNTNWDETMPNTGILLEVTGGVVSGMGGNMTCTVPAHPDLEFWLPTSPGQWEARDERSDRDEVDLGLIRGTYALRDGVVPEPSSLTLLCIGTFSLLAFCRRRRK